MSAARPLLPPAAAEKLALLRARWKALAPRERQLVVLASVLVGASVLWVAAVQPALQTLREAPARIDRLDAQLQRLRGLAAETQSLREAAPLSTAQATEALRSAVDLLGDDAKLSLQGDRASVSLNDVDPESLRDFLLEARSVARARPLEAQLSRSANGYTGTLIVGIGGTP